MKKVQNLLTKPEELRKRLECPSFRHDFVQWSKLQLCSAQSRHSRSKSPNELSKKKLNPSLPKPLHNKSKENIIPNSANKNPALPRRIPNSNKNLVEPWARPDRNQRKKGQSQSLTHFHSLNNINHNTSLDEPAAERYRTNYSSLHRSREDSAQRMKAKKKKLEEISMKK
jgi:hypothetical protein